MAALAVRLSTLTVLLVIGATLRRSSKFPLSDCKTGQFDILLLQTKSWRGSNFEVSLPKMIADVWLLQDDTDNSRVLVSSVHDNLTGSDSKCNFELTRFDQKVINICSSLSLLYSGDLKRTSLRGEIQLKQKMATGIFSMKDIGRENSTHIAVILINSLYFPSVTVDEIWRIPEFLQEHSSDMNVFVILHDFGTEVEPIFLSDTLVAGRYMTSQHVSMALCKHCLPGWFQLEYKESKEFISCYKLQAEPVAIGWSASSKSCSEQGQHLATVETTEELEFLQAQLFVRLLANKHLIYNSTDSDDPSAVVFIGLKRNIESVSKRFHWVLKQPTRYRPLVINHWLPDNPAGGFNQACGVWTFRGIFNYTIPVHCDPENTSASRSLFIEAMSGIREGWMSLGCGMQFSRVSLCEVTLSRHISEQSVVILDPANKESYDKALNKNNFLEYEGNIVSVSSFANNEHFLKFLKDNNKEFPLFDCGSGAGNPRYISYTYVSDGVKHCSTGRDETVHPLRACLILCECVSFDAVCDVFKDCKDGDDEKNCQTSCPFKRCCDGTCLPSNMFNDGEIDCSECLLTGNKNVNDESSFYESYNELNESCAFICNREQCIYPSQLNNDSPDCTGVEGPLDETIGILETSKSCFNKMGRPYWAPRCVYFKDRYDFILGCRDLSHLQNCSDFPCQEGYYKCPGSYCIPLHYVQDGKSDCPSGEEESYIVNFICLRNFRCWDSKMCLYPDQVCDGHSHCPHKDDELNCDVSCIEGLHCAASTVTVDRSNPLVYLDNITFMDYYTRYLDLSGVDLSNMALIEDTFVDLFDVTFSGCRLLNLYDSFPISSCCSLSLYRIDVSYNLITSIVGDKYPFDWSLNLRELNLSNNRHLEEFVNVSCEFLENLDLSYTGLLYLNMNSFYGFPHLNFLSLSHTRVSTFHRDIFPSHFTLQTLDLRGSPVAYFFENTYNGLIMTSSLYTDNFGMCCPQVRGTSVMEYMCHASENAISSCFDLIGLEIQRILIWLMAVMALLWNLTVVCYRLIWDRVKLKKAYGLFVLNLSISDLIMGLYLLLIAAADVFYRGVYVLYDLYWRESVVCKIAGFLATLSSETSTFFIFLITVDRFLTLRFPYGQIKFSRFTTYGVISFTWGSCLLFAMIPTLPTFGNDSVLTSTAMCNGLLLTNKLKNGWEYSLGVFIILNFIMFLLTAIGQVGIFKSMSANRVAKKSTNQNDMRRAQDITVAKQLSLVVLSNFICWFPLGFVGFLSLSGHEIGNDVYAWTVILVLPLNSVINPVLYTIPIIITHWEKYKKDKSRPH